MGKIYTLFFAMTVAVLASGCGHQISKEEQQVREVATKYHDAYVDGFSTATSMVGSDDSNDLARNLARGSIQSVETWSNGWDVVFATKAGGKLGYVVHVYVESDGRLNRIVRDFDK